MVITVFANVISRYFFSTSLNWVDELSRAAFVWSAFIGIVIVMWEKGHIGLGNVLNNINPTLGRIASLIGVILQIIFTIYLFMGGMRLFLLTIVQLTPYLAIPCGYIYSIAPVMTVNGKFYGRLDSKKAEKIILDLKKSEKANINSKK